MYQGALNPQKIRISCSNQTRYNPPDYELSLVANKTTTGYDCMSYAPATRRLGSQALLLQTLLSGFLLSPHLRPSPRLYSTNATVCLVQGACANQTRRYPFLLSSYLYPLRVPVLAGVPFRDSLCRDYSLHVTLVIYSSSASYVYPFS